MLTQEKFCSTLLHTVYIELFFAVVNYCGRCVLEKRFIGNTFLFEYGLAKIMVAPGGTLWPKNLSTKLLHIVLCYTQGVVAYDPVLFGSCIPPPLTPLQIKPEALILISIGGRTLQCGVKYIFMFLCYQNWILSPSVEVKRLIKQHKTEIKNVSFCIWNMWQAIQSLGWPRSGWPLSFTLCYKFVTGVNHPTNLLLLFEMMASNMEK